MRLNVREMIKRIKVPNSMKMGILFEIKKDIILHLLWFCGLV